MRKSVGESITLRKSNQLKRRDVRYWPKADMPSCAAHVRFRRQSRHDFLRRECLLLTQSGQGATPGRRLFYHPCFAARLGGVSGGKETHGWRDSSHTAMVGAGNFGSAKLPTATATYPGKPSPSQKTVEPHVGQK